MTGRSDTERFLDAFLAPEADQLSHSVLEAALSDIARTPQRRALRVPWRFTNMPVMYRVAAAALALVVLAGAGGVIYLNSRGALVGGPAASPSPTASPSPSTSAQDSPPLLETTFSSTIHGVSIDYPSGWQTRPATEPWTGGDLSFDSPAADVLHDPTLGDRVYLLLASQPYGGLGKDGWRGQAVHWLCPGGSGFGSLGFLGLDGWIVECAPKEAAFVLSETRGYVIRRIVSSDDPGLAETYDWEWFKSVLRTVDLRPEEAVDAPSPSGSP
jgi:hypothetical protein